MKSLTLMKGVAAALLLCSAVWAQEVLIRGPVARVDPQTLTLTLRTTANTRVVQVAPDAVVTMGGRLIRLDEIPLNSEVQIRAVSGTNRIARATQITVTAPSNMPSAAAPPGSQIEGTLLAVNRPNNQIWLRTTAGDVVVPLGTAPIVSAGGRQLSTANLRAGDRIMVARSIPTPGGINYVTQRITVMGGSGTPPTRASDAPVGAPMDRTSETRVIRRDGNAESMTVRGTVMGIHLPTNFIRVRTPIGDIRIAVGTAPVTIDGQEYPLSLLRVGDRVEVQSAPREMADSTSPVQRVTVTERTAGYRGTTGSDR